MKLYRNEWKYRAQEADLDIVENRLSGVLDLDAHSSPIGKYVVHSLYFDDYKDICAKENEAGVSRRYKYRIRYYGNNSDFLRLECKEKLDGRCHKESTVITREMYEKIVDGRADELYWETENQLIKAFCVRIMMRFFEAKAIIDYERSAYVEEISNIRITFDRNISVSNEVSQFLTGDYISYPIQEKKEHILEVKFDHILPTYIKSIATDKSLQQSSASKYYLGRLMMQNMGIR